MSKGFTIIEVLIVLLIAGVILSFVFWAVPAIQKSESVETPCSEYKDKTVEYLPMRCYEYYNVESVK